jgi:hypothetical protein
MSEEVEMEPCPLCDDSGCVEISSGGIWTGEAVHSRYEICDCPCGDDVRRELKARAGAKQ